MFNIYNYNGGFIIKIIRLFKLLLDENIYMTFYERDRLYLKIDDLIKYLEKLKKETKL